MATTRHGGLYGTQRYANLVVSQSVLRVCHETRKALEMLIEDILPAGTAIQWPNRPVTILQSASSGGGSSSEGVTRHGGMYGTQPCSFEGRGVSDPITGFWRVHAIQWTTSGPRTIGPTAARLGRIEGRFVVDIYGAQGQGMGVYHDHADLIRDALNRVTLDTPADMEARCYTPSGPQPVLTEKGYTGIRLVTRVEIVEIIGLGN